MGAPLTRAEIALKYSFPCLERELVTMGVGFPWMEFGAGEKA
jgi:hypothetical protein